MVNEYVNVSYEPSHITIEFYHPASNSLPSGMLKDLEQAFLISKDQPHSIILFKSAGDRAFCGGASFEELSSISTPEEGFNFFSGFGKVILAMISCPKIIVTQVQGKAVGGGVGLISASDFVIGTNFSSIRLSELAVGIGPFVIGPVVERKIGNTAFKKMALTPEEWQTAKWGKENLLFDEVFEHKEQLESYTQFLIEKWVSYNPSALKELKQIFWENTEHWKDLLMERAKISGLLALSDFTKQAISKYTTT